MYVYHLLCIGCAYRKHSHYADKQLIVNNDILSGFEHLLKDYFNNNLQLKNGLPTVQYCAEKLCMSANYLGDVIKRVSGETAGNYIKRIIVQEAKNRLASGLSISETAYDLGFEYPQHLSRMFKKHTGMTPSENFAQIFSKNKPKS